MTDIQQQKTIRRPRVMIESPFRGFAYSLGYLKSCILDSLRRGEAPFAMHGFYTQWLDDEVPAERELGLTCGEHWLRAADLVAFYTDHGLSEGMHRAMDICLREGIPCVDRRIAP